MQKKRGGENLILRNLLNVSTPSSWSELFGGSGVTTSGEVITPEGAFENIGTVYACVGIRARAVSKLPLHVYVKKDGSNIRVHDSVSELLEKRPNKYQTPSQFKSYIEVSKMLWGNAYIKIEYDRKGDVSALIPLEPDRTTILANENRDYFYRYLNQSGGYEVYGESEIIHLPYLSSNGKVGVSPLSVARENAGNLKAISKFEGQFYKNGTLTTGVLSTPAQLNKEAKQRVKEEWQSLYGGTANSGSIAILDGGFDYKPLTLPLKDMEFIASRKLNKNEIATIFDVPAYMLNDLDNAKFDNVEQQNLRFLSDTLLSNIVAMEEEFSYKMFLDKSKYVKFDLKTAMRADSKTRAEYYKEMISMGVMNINEVRLLEEYDQIGDIGDKHYMSLNYTTLDTLEKHNRIVQEGGEDDEEDTNKGNE